METVFFIQLGTGIDQHGQDITTAAVRAVQDAIRPNAMPGLRSVLPDRGDKNDLIYVVNAAVEVGY